MIYFYLIDGRITRSANCDLTEAALGAVEGESYISAGGGFSDETHYITYVGDYETPTLTAFPTRPSDWHLWNYSTGQWELSTEQLTAARRARYAELSDVYAASREVPFGYDGYTLSCSDLHIDGIRCVVAQIETNGLMPDEWNGWRTTGGTRMPNTYALESELARAKAILAVAEGQRARCFSVFLNHMDAIDAMTTAEGLSSYDITTGWPT